MDTEEKIDFFAEYLDKKSELDWYIQDLVDAFKNRQIIERDTYHIVYKEAFPDTLLQICLFKSVETKAFDFILITLSKEVVSKSFNNWLSKPEDYRHRIEDIDDIIRHWQDKSISDLIHNNQRCIKNNQSRIAELNRKVDSLLKNNEELENKINNLKNKQ